MRKTNHHFQKNKKGEKVRIVAGHQQKNQNTSMNYLVMNKQQLQEVRKIINKKHQHLLARVEEAGDPKNMRSDEVLKQLEELLRQAKNHDFNEEEKKIVLTLGRRLLYLQIQLRKQDMQQKRINKQKIEMSFFRHKKIKKFKYEQQTKRKLRENAYIIRPYNSGKGFIQSEIFYRDEDQVHLQRLRECEYLKIAKEVNKIYMNNYSHFSAQSNKSFQNGPVINFVLVLCAILVIMAVVILSTSQFQYIQYCLIANLLFIVFILSALGIKTFLQKPNKNNQLEQTKSDVRDYFQKINEINKKEGKKFTWICPEDFMYLQVRFDDDQ